MDIPEPGETPEPDPRYPCGALSWWPDLAMPPGGVTWIHVTLLRPPPDSNRGAQLA